jgi:hypothetical protein
MRQNFAIHASEAQQALNTIVKQGRELFSDF